MTAVETVQSPALSCHFFSQPTTSSVKWTLVSDTTGGATTRHLATCTGVHNCTSDVSPQQMSVYWTESMISYVRFDKVKREFSGTIFCTEVLSNGTEESASCRLRVVREYGILWRILRSFQNQQVPKS